MFKFRIGVSIIVYEMKHELLKITKIYTERLLLY